MKAKIILSQERLNKHNDKLLEKIKNAPKQYSISGHVFDHHYEKPGDDVLHIEGKTFYWNGHEYECKE